MAMQCCAGAVQCCANAVLWLCKCCAVAMQMLCKAMHGLDQRLCRVHVVAVQGPGCGCIEGPSGSKCESVWVHM